MGLRKATGICWALLGAGTLILAMVTSASSYWIPLLLTGTLLCAVGYSWKSPRRDAMFSAILAVVIIEVVVLLIATTQQSSGG